MQTFGKYHLLERIARGGMAEVWRAEAPGAEGFVKEVALKLIRGDHAACGDFERMFIQEARLASRLTHANVVQVFDFDRVDGRYYIAMELVRGHTLREVVDRCRTLGVRLGLARSVHVCAEVARALAYAHRFDAPGRPGASGPQGAGAEGGSCPAPPAGLVHRDVSPQNVLVSFEGEVKLTDFGIARALGVAEVTAPGTIKGKLAYMAPEQARGEGVDGRADVFALGVVLWELCTGRRLFERDSDAATLAAVISPQPISPPSAWNEDVPPELDALALSALEQDVARRAATAEDLAAGLASLRLRLAAGHEDLDLRALMWRLWPEGPSRAAHPEPDDTAVRPARPLPVNVEDLSTRTAVRPPRRSPSRAWSAGAIAALLLAASAAGWVGWRGRRAGSGRADRAGTPGPMARAGPSSPDPHPEATGAGPSPAPGAAAPSIAAARTPSPSLSPPPGGTGEAGRGNPPAPAISVVPPPPPQAAEGSVTVHATPWAYVTIDGAAAGETPIDRLLPAGPHRLRARHPTLGEDEILVKLAPGQRYVWKPKLSP